MSEGLNCAFALEEGVREYDEGGKSVLRVSPGPTVMNF